MAEALWHLRFGEQANVRSCGVIPAAYVDPFTVAVMMEKGVDLSEVSPIALRGIGEPFADVIISLSTAADQMALEYSSETGAEFLTWPIPDPSETGGHRDQRISAYRDTREAISSQIVKWENSRKSA